MSQTVSTHQDAAVLDNPAWPALDGPHASFAIGDDLVRRYPADVAPFVAVRTWEDPRVWDALAELVGPGADHRALQHRRLPPAGWEILGRGDGVQLVQTDALRRPSRRRGDPARLGGCARDARACRAQRARTVPAAHARLGRYIGIRRDGRSSRWPASGSTPRAGPRSAPSRPMWSTDGQGLASRLVLDVAFHIQERGDRALLHAAATNVGAIAVYERLGFILRRHTTFSFVRTPA